MTPSSEPALPFAGLPGPRQRPEPASRVLDSGAEASTRISGHSVDVVVLEDVDDPVVVHQPRQPALVVLLAIRSMPAFPAILGRILERWCRKIEEVRALRAFDRMLEDERGHEHLVVPGEAEDTLGSRVVGSVDVRLQTPDLSNPAIAREAATFPDLEPQLIALEVGHLGHGAHGGEGLFAMETHAQVDARAQLGCDEQALQLDHLMGKERPLPTGH